MEGEPELYVRLARGKSVHRILRNLLIVPIEAPRGDREVQMGKITAIAVNVLLVCSMLRAQGVLSPHAYLRDGVIEHHGTTATVKADFGVPLAQAVAVVSAEYGWAIHYEDPPYQSKYDVMDGVNPQYRATHPDTPIVPVPSGGAFQSTYPETSNMWVSTSMEQQVLEKIVSDYNLSGNPGNFAVRQLSDGSFDVVGISVRNDSGALVAIAPVLDTQISIPLEARTFDGTITTVLNALTTKTGFGMVIGAVPMNALNSPWTGITVGGSIAPARDLLMSAIDPMMKNHYVWDLLYRPRDQRYVFNLRHIARVEHNTFIPNQ